ncbi:hypothetical protein [Lolliginicoccus levis]|uniref:hypothetical protein n=1 Tax=Lolliginicoccus levis TaxID=2919542 RepID=UPI00241FD4EE|nr:hypothetical protein [Lolliginicoccus levis]
MIELILRLIVRTGSSFTHTDAVSAAKKCCYKLQAMFDNSQQVLSLYGQAAKEFMEVSTS